MAMAFDFDETTAYVSALLRGSNLVASARPLAPVVLHLHVFEFSDEALTLACPPEYTDFSMHLVHLVDPRGLNYIIPDILSHTYYNNLETRQFWEEELTDYAASVGLLAFGAGVQELELNVDIHIRNWARRILEVEQEIVEQMIYDSGEEIGRGDFGRGALASEEVVKDNGVGGEFEQNGCSMCLEEFKQDDYTEVTRMPCKHVFHGDCLLRWLEETHLCPLCRHDIPI